ncbi:UNVERIFIED_CONTAM: hypothetical protein FKN15_044733 [Acipenser sinensis]
MSNQTIGQVFRPKVGFQRLRISQGPLAVEISAICENRKMNVAHGLAWSFYIGYLKLVLPNKLEEEDSNIEFLDNLPDIVIDRAGVRRRVYKHSLYAVYDGAKRVRIQTQHIPVLLKHFQHRHWPVLPCVEASAAIYLPAWNMQDSEAVEDPHFLSKVILKNLQQQEKEEYSLSEGSEVQPDQHEAMSRDPTLMISNDALRSLMSQQYTQ